MYYVCVLSHFSCVSLRPYGLQPARLLCPWNSLDKNTGMSCHVLQGIFLTLGSNLHLLHWQVGSLAPPGKPHTIRPKQMGTDGGEVRDKVTQHLGKTIQGLLQAGFQGKVPGVWIEQMGGWCAR